MTTAEITLVKESFLKILPVADQVAALFYARLFEIDPSLRPLFRSDRTAQGHKLMSMIAAAVASLDRLDDLAPALRQLSLRHVGYGMREEHFTSVGLALLWTLEKGLGSDFTPAVRDAWTSTYTLLATTMIEASFAAPAAA